MHPVPVRSILKAAALAACLQLPAIAFASQTVTPGLTVHNKCPKDIVIAVHYKDSRGNWTTSPFINIRARQTRRAVVSSPNRVFYYYAESTSGRPSRWTGDKNFKVDGKVYPMKERTLERENNQYTLSLTCTNNP